MAEAKGRPFLEWNWILLELNWDAELSFYKHVHGLGCHFHLVGLPSEAGACWWSCGLPAWECKPSPWEAGAQVGGRVENLQSSKPEEGLVCNLLLPPPAAASGTWPRSCKIVILIWRRIRSVLVPQIRGKALVEYNQQPCQRRWVIEPLRASVSSLVEGHWNSIFLDLWREWTEITHTKVLSSMLS